jgi:hypothetical protein
MRLLDKIVPQLPKDLCGKMIEYANEVRRMFIGSATDSGSRMDTVLDITF